MALTVRHREVNFIYHLINVKLLSNHRSGAKAYTEILRDIYKNKINVKVSRGKTVMIRTQFEKEIDGHLVIYGKIARFTTLESNKWINRITRAIEDPQIPDNLSPNLQETDCFFFPFVHRFVLLKSSEFTLNNAYDFLEQAVIEVIREDEGKNIIIEQSTDIFKEIFEAEIIEKLEVTISYTNADISSDAIEWADNILKDAQAKKAVMKFESSKHESININNKFIEGVVGLAQNNGKVEAVVKGRNKKREKIVTEEHPKQIKRKAKNEDDVISVIYQDVKKEYADDTRTDRGTAE